MLTQVSLGQWSGSDATIALHKTIKAYHAETSRQTDKLIGLTWAITGLTGAMLIGLVVQIYIAAHN